MKACVLFWQVSQIIILSCFLTDIFGTFAHVPCILTMESFPFFRQKFLLRKLWQQTTSPFSIETRRRFLHPLIVHLKICRIFFNFCVCLSTSSETRFKTTQNFKNARFLFYFDSTNITILFVVVIDKFCALKFAHVANAIVDMHFRRIAECFAFFVFFKVRKNAFSFVIFWTNKILSSTSSIQHRSYFCS